jgi:hypothetical protein
MRGIRKAQEKLSILRAALKLASRAAIRIMAIGQDISHSAVVEQLRKHLQLLPRIVETAALFAPRD